MATQRAPALLLLLLLLVALLLSVHSRVEPTDTAPTLIPAPALTPDGNSLAGQALPGTEIKVAARTARPVPSPLALLAPLIPLALRLVLR